VVIGFEGRKWIFRLEACHLENLNTTPIGQVLKKISSLPEVRKEKILDVRQQLTEGKYALNEHLDVALDRVLEELTA